MPLRPSPAFAFTTARAVALAVVLTLAGCDPAPRADVGAAPAAAAADDDPEARAVLEAAHLLVADAAEVMDEALRPVPFLRSGEERDLRRYLQNAQLARARALGVSPPADTSALAALERRGALVRLPDETEGFIVRELDHSVPLVTPATRTLLDDIASRFQAVLAERGLPPLRVEVSSALRTEAMQDALQDVNSNAARGTSTHSFGTSIDIAYNSFAAAPDVDLFDGLDAPDWLRPHLDWMARTAVERIAAQRSGELKALLGGVLIELQDEGRVMVTLEERQPVYHMTVAR